MATFDDVGARVICGGLHPDHSTSRGVVAGTPRRLRPAAREIGEAGAREGWSAWRWSRGRREAEGERSMASNVNRGS